MLRDAINEIRLHPGRFVATLLAVAISVGFISAIMIGVRTEENSMTRSGAIAVSKSDVVVEQVSANEQIKPDEVLKAIQGASGVTQAETSMVALFPRRGFLAFQGRRDHPVQGGGGETPREGRGQGHHGLLEG